MAALITYDQAKEHLRLTGDEEENDLTLKMEQASAIVITYLKRPNHGWDVSTDPNDDPEFAIVQAAILMVLADLYRDRGDEDVDVRGEEWTAVNMRPGVRRALMMLRDPTVA